MEIIIVKNANESIHRVIPVDPAKSKERNLSKIRAEILMGFSDKKIVVWDTETNRALHTESVLTAETLKEMREFIRGAEVREAIMVDAPYVNRVITAVRVVRARFKFPLLFEIKDMIESVWG